jgi:hypothetical protein
MDQSNLEKEQTNKEARTGLLERQVGVEEEQSPSINRLRQSQANYYDRMPEAGKGSAKARLDALDREEKIKWFMRNYGLDRTEAIGQLAIAEANDYANVGGVGNIQAMLKELEGGIEVDPEGRASMADYLSGYTLQPVKPIPSNVDPQEVLDIDSDPAKRKAAISAYGPEPWRKLVAATKRDMGVK